MQCRACRNFDCEDAAMNMSEVVPSDGKTLYDYFNDCTQLKASTHDHLPKILCINCVQSLQQAYTFRQEALKSDEVLRQILHITKTEPGPVYNYDESSKDFQEDLQSENMHTIIELPSTSPKKTFTFEDTILSLPSGSTGNEPTVVYEPTEPTEQPGGLEDTLCEVSTYDPLSTKESNRQQRAIQPAPIIADEQQQPLNIIKEEIKMEHSDDMLEDSNDYQFEESSSSDDEDESCDDSEFPRRSRRTYICDYCVYKCAKQHVLKKHIFELHKDNISCVKCCKVYETPEEIKLHNKLVHGTRSRMRCNWCKNSEPIPIDELTKHLQSAHRSVYLKFFPRTRALGRSEGDPFPCESCPKNFTTIYELAEHKQEHKYDCPLCFMIFRKHSSYRAHVFRTHSLTLTKLKEIVSGNEEPNVEQLQKQIEEEREKLQKQQEQINMQAKEYSCPVCFKEFKNRSSYSSHMIRTHNLTLTKIKEIIKGDEQNQPQQEKAQKQEKPKQQEKAEKQEDQLHQDAAMQQENLQEDTCMQENKYECPLCLKGFEKVSSYGSHMLRKHNLTLTTLKKMGKEDEENKYECPICFKGFQKRNSYSSHVLRKHNITLTTLKNMKSGKAEVYIQNQGEQPDEQQQEQPEQDVKENKHECPICFAEFHKTSSYSSHVLRKHNISITKLKKLTNGSQKQKQNKDIESSTLNDPQNVIHAINEEHDYANSLISEQGESDYESELVECTKYCHKMIPASEIIAHERYHVDKLKNASETTPVVKEERKYICSYCCQVFKTEFYVKLHEKKVHLCDGASERKECPVCHKTFEKRYLKSHLRNVHTDGEKFTCEICGDLFKSNLSLKSHKKLHMERKFQCTMCDKGFIRQAVLKVHMRSHTGEEPYVCHICDQSFKTKIRLNYHLQRHAGVKHYCKVCCKEFNYADQLRVHAYKHTGMPYQCTICEYKTGHREKFTAHLRKKHDNQTMTTDELAEMFKKNTGRYPRVWIAKPEEKADAGQEAECSN